jgi:hypothetical protein
LSSVGAAGEIGWFMESSSHAESDMAVFDGSKTIEDLGDPVAAAYKFFVKNVKTIRIMPCRL